MHATIRNTFDANWLNRLVYYGVASRQFFSAIGKTSNLQWTPSSMVTSAKLQANRVLKILAKLCCTCRKVAYCHCFAVACNNTSQSKARVLLITFQHNNFKSSNNSSCNRLYTNVGFIIPYRTKLFIGTNDGKIHVTGNWTLYLPVNSSQVHHHWAIRTLALRFEKYLADSRNIYAVNTERRQHQREFLCFVI